MAIKTHKRIIGIDFSGAKDACKKIWLAEGVIQKSTLVIERCIRAGELFDLGNDRRLCYKALRNYLKNHSGAVVGLDFPFGLPEKIVAQPSWDRICKTGSLRIEGDDLRRAVNQDRNGDALDSLVAAAATFKARKDIEVGRNAAVKNMVEGWVYA